MTKTSFVRFYSYCFKTNRKWHCRLSCACKSNYWIFRAGVNVYRKWNAVQSKTKVHRPTAKMMALKDKRLLFESLFIFICVRCFAQNVRRIIEVSIRAGSTSVKMNTESTFQGIFFLVFYNSECRFLCT